MAPQAEEVRNIETADGCNFCRSARTGDPVDQTGGTVLESGLAPDVEGILTATSSAFMAVVAKRTAIAAAIADGSRHLAVGLQQLPGQIRHT